MSDPTTTTTTTTVDPNIYRFAAFKFQLQAPSRQGLNEMVSQDTGAYAFPKGDESKDPSVRVYDPDAPV